MDVKLLPLEETPNEIQVVLYSTGVMTLYKRPAQGTSILATMHTTKLCEELPSGYKSHDLTDYAIRGVESLQSAVRGIIQDNILESALLPFCVYKVEIAKRDALTASNPLLDVRGNFRTKKLLGFLPYRTVYQCLASHTALAGVATNESFWEAVSQIPATHHPKDKGFNGYTSVVVGEAEVGHVR